MRLCCRQLHDPIFAMFGLNGANCCEQRIWFENNRDIDQATCMKNGCCLSPNNPGGLIFTADISSPLASEALSTPEPTSWMTMLIGVGAVLAGFRKRLLATCR